MAKRQKDDLINVFDVADYFLEETEFKMTHMKLHKLIYYAHVRHLLKHKEILTDAEIQAWVHGPHLVCIYRSYFESLYG